MHFFRRRQRVLSATYSFSRLMCKTLYIGQPNGVTRKDMIDSSNFKLWDPVTYTCSIWIDRWFCISKSDDHTKTELIKFLFYWLIISFRCTVARSKISYTYSKCSPVFRWRKCCEVQPRLCVNIDGDGEDNIGTCRRVRCFPDLSMWLWCWNPLMMCYVIFVREFRCVPHDPTNYLPRLEAKSSYIDKIQSVGQFFPVPNPRKFPLCISPGIFSLKIYRSSRKVETVLLFVEMLCQNR